MNVTVRDQIPTTDWGKLATAVPIDEVAARVVSQAGIVVPTTDGAHKGIRLRAIPPGAENFTGVVIGKLTVIGLCELQRKVPLRQHKWLVRCDCGNHEMRQLRWLRKPPPKHEACCFFCRTVLPSES